VVAAAKDDNREDTDTDCFYFCSQTRIQEGILHLCSRQLLDLPGDATGYDQSAGKTTVIERQRKAGRERT